MCRISVSQLSPSHLRASWVHRLPSVNCGPVRLLLLMHTRGSSYTAVPVSMFTAQQLIVSCCESGCKPWSTDFVYSLNNKYCYVGCASNCSLVTCIKSSQRHAIVWEEKEIDFRCWMHTVCSEICWCLPHCSPCWAFSLDTFSTTEFFFYLFFCCLFLSFFFLFKSAFII